MNIKIIVCCHKQDVMATSDPYYPIQVGKSLSNVNLGIQGDDEGDNISEKNPSYCELTGMYWAWKNLKNVDYIGLCHYRRYFDFHNQCVWPYPQTSFPTESFSQLDLSLPPKVVEDLQHGCIVMPKDKSYNYSLHTDYCLNHISDDIKVVAEVIKENFSEYYDAYVKIMHSNHKLMHYNMFIMSWKEFDKYCTWLFAILSMVEEKINIDSYNSIQMRIFGYMSERLMNVYVYANNLKLKQYPIIWFNDGDAYEDNNRIKHLVRRLIYSCSFGFFKLGRWLLIKL